LDRQEACDLYPQRTERDEGHSGTARRHLDMRGLCAVIFSGNPAGKVVAQWNGSGGDSVRYAFGSVWLTDLRGEKVWRIKVP
jgi:hypothetical protein